MASWCSSQVVHLWSKWFFFLFTVHAVSLYEPRIHVHMFKCNPYSKRGEVRLHCYQTNFSTRVTLEFDGWPQKIIGHLFYTTSFVHHFKSIGEFKLKLQSGNAQFRSKLAIFLSRVTLKFDGWPWKTIRHVFYTTSSFVHHFKAMGQFKLELVRKRSMRVKIGNFLSRVTLKFDESPWKAI